MPIINHDYKDIHFLEQIIRKDDGTPLYGEIDMYKRIFKDCTESPLHWHFWHDCRLPIPVKGQSGIQIDFFLACEYGAIIIEVKGGKIEINDGQYHLRKNDSQAILERTPFDQAEDYKWALKNNKVVDFKKIFVTSACAFPHTHMDKTNDNEEQNEGWKLWSAFQQEDADKSFADFCINVLEEDKRRKNIFKGPLDENEITDTLKNFLFNFVDDTAYYTQSSLESIIEWLKVDSLSTFNSLRRNKRLVIEGGPGTGKTTIAKAFIKRYNDLKGIYICWNKLLESKIRYELGDEGLNNCEVVQYASFLLKIQKRIASTNLTLDDIVGGNIDKIRNLLFLYRESDCFQPFNYIIIDEAQDILDKGAVMVLQKLSFFEDGLSTGCYMVFYDVEQGFNNQKRKIQSYIEPLVQYSASFILDENKRVPQNKEIDILAKQLLAENNCDNIITSIENSTSLAYKVHRFRIAKELINYIKNHITNIRDFSMNECVLLAHSSTQKTDCGESLYDRIKTCREITELDENNICQSLKGLPLTTILRFKGLESKKVILVLNKRTYIDNYELYIGMTRTIVELEILILE